jgi:hypothetical protein
MLDVHFVKNLSEVLRVHDLSVLYFEKVLAAVPIHVNKQLCLLICLYSLGLWKVFVVSPTYQVEYGLVCKIIRFVVDLDIFTVQVLSVLNVEVQCTRVWITGIASMVLGEHEYDAVISDAHALEVIVDREGVTRVAIVEVELRRRQ